MGLYRKRGLRGRSVGAGPSTRGSEHLLHPQMHLLHPQMLEAAKRGAELQTAAGAPGVSGERAWLVRVMLSKDSVAVQLSTTVTKPQLLVIASVQESSSHELRSFSELRRVQSPS